MAESIGANSLSEILMTESSTGIRKSNFIVELYDELRPSLFGYLICLGLMPQEADDIIQDAFVQLFRFTRAGGWVNNPRSWLFRVARNLAFNLQKRERRVVSVSAELQATALSEWERVPDPEELYEHKERLRLLMVAIGELPQRQRECLHLRAEGLRYREIADVLGITPSAVSESLKHAVMQLMGKFYD